MVGRIVALEVLAILIRNTLHGKRDFAGMINVTDIEMRRFSDWSGYALPNCMGRELFPAIIRGRCTQI